jgi:hypothetical protein
VEKKGGDSKNDPAVPIWFHFERRWYLRLNAIAKECGLSMEEVLSRGVKLVLKEHREKAAPGAPSGPTKSARKTGADLVRRRWEKTPKEERSKFGREMARKRWSKNRSPNRAA